MTSYPISLLVALAATALAHAVLPAGTQKPLHGEPGGRSTRIGMGLWVGLAVATALLGAFQQRLPLPPGENRGVGPALWPLLLAALPLLAAALKSDFGRPKSERHLLGLLGSGIVLSFVGFSVFIITAPWSGTVSLAPLLVVVFTVLWLFLLSSIVELVSLVPMGAPLFGLALSGVVWLSGGSQQTVASYTLAGMVAGAVLGRALADGVARRSLPYGKAEVFALGLWLTALTNVAFLKSVALAGFVLPLGVLTVGIVVVMLQAFEKSLLLRETPR
ncbi:MAG: hypothetical protein PWP23_803 [Candidatus Sumerlaeota bacterium]|nr:hypothetical protein [Candidatus Sumerlaeota bacterium]